MKKIIPFLILFGCNTNQNYDKSMLPDADPKTLSKINSKVLITCMQIPVPLPPVPINTSSKVPNKEIYDSNDCFDNKIAKNESNKVFKDRKDKKNFKLDISIEEKDIEGQTDKE